MPMLISHGGIKIENSEGITKSYVREKIWTFMIERNIARKPIPIFNRIPNFEGAGKSANRISSVEAFLSSQIIKVDPDKPLEDVRFLSLVFRKKLLVPSPRLQSGLFKLLWNDSEDDIESLRNKVQSEGIKNLSIPLDLNLKIKVDVIVSGAVAVSLAGRRIGKGEGFADLEYALMKNMNMIKDDTFVIAVVHDCQVFDELPPQLFQEHDVPVDVIVTPTQIIYTKHSLPKPEGIYWHLLSEEKIRQIPILSLLQSLPKNNEEKSSTSSHSASFNPKPSTNFEGYDKGRGNSTSRPNRGRNPYNYDREQSNSYFNHYKHQDHYNSYPKRKEKPYGNQSSDPSRQEKNDNGHIHVTISVDKRNHVINRTVEESRELDRVGDASETTQAQSGETEKNPNFTIYVGGIPKECRFTDLRDELKKREVKPSYIAWKGFDYAFLDFQNSDCAVSDILESLKDLSLKGKTLKVNHKQYPKDKNYQNEGTSKYNYKKNLNETNRSSTENSPINSAKSTKYKNAKTEKTDDKMQNGAKTEKTDDKIQNGDNLTKETSVSLSEASSSKTDDPKKIVTSTECENAKTEKAENQNAENGDTRNEHCSSSLKVIETQNNNKESVEGGWKEVDDQNNTSEDRWGSLDESLPVEDSGWT